MDPWRYYEVTHSNHAIMNPTSDARLVTLAEVLALQPQQLVLDVGCGHGELLLRWFELAGTTGVGVEASPYQAKRARDQVAQRAPGRVVIMEGRGEDFASEDRFDVSCCLGATWIWGGYRGALKALAGFTRPGGVVVVGEPYWRQEPSLEYLKFTGVQRDSLPDLAQCRRIALDMGFGFIWMASASVNDCDGYEMLQSATLDAFGQAHPDDPDLAEMRAKRGHFEEMYFRWERACIGWAMWAFRVPGGRAHRRGQWKNPGRWRVANGTLCFEVPLDDDLGVGLARVHDLANHRSHDPRDSRELVVAKLARELCCDDHGAQTRKEGAVDQGIQPMTPGGLVRCSKGVFEALQRNLSLGGQGRVGRHRFAHKHRKQIAALLVELQIRVNAGANGVVRRGGQGLHERGQHFVHGLLIQRLQDQVLVGKIEVEGPTGALGLFDDVSDRRPADPQARECSASAGENSIAGGTGRGCHGAPLGQWVGRDNYGG